MRAVALALLLAVLAACGPGQQYQVATLPSGKQVKVLGVTKMYSTNGKNKWLILNYRTDLAIDDVTALRKEADEIWPHFKIDVERAGMDEAAIRASTPPTGFILTKSNTRTTAYKKSADGHWARIGD